MIPPSLHLLEGRTPLLQKAPFDQTSGLCQQLNLNHNISKLLDFQELVPKNGSG
jgi:hypothetical protein